LHQKVPLTSTNLFCQKVDFTKYVYRSHICDIVRFTKPVAIVLYILKAILFCSVLGFTNWLSLRQYVRYGEDQVAREVPQLAWN